MKKFNGKGKFSVFLLAALMFAIWPVIPAFSQDSPSVSVETEAERDKVYMKIGKVTVTEKDLYLKTADLPTSVDVLGGDQIENENIDFSMELFKKLPGTYFGGWKQGVTSGTFSMRGHDANHAVVTALIVDGIPHNWARGSMDIQPFFPMEIERIELVKGTNDPRYGLNNIAGNANVFTKRGGNYSQAKLVHGSFQTSEGNILLSREDGGFSQTYFAGYRETDGYRDHSDMDKSAVSGKWFYTTNDDRLSVGLIARFFDMDADAPGYLTKEQYEDDPEQVQSYSKSDGGEQENRHASLHLDYNFTEKLTWSFKTYAQHLEQNRWFRWLEKGQEHERVRDEDQHGAISTLTYETADWGIKNLRLSWGADYQHQDNINQRYDTEDRVRDEITRDWDYTTWYVGTYVQADGEMTDWLRLIAAMRVDHVDGEFENKVTGVKMDMIDYGNIWQPKIGTVITPYSGYNLYANWGRSFQIAAESDRFGQTAKGVLFDDRNVDYSKNEGWEAGIKLSPVKWLAARVSYWEQDATDEVKLLTDNSGDYGNVGETERRGWDLVLNVKPHEWVSLWGSYTRQEAEYTDPGPTKEAIKGNDIALIPDYTLKAGVDFEHPIGFSMSLWLESQDDYYVEANNIESRVGEYDVVNLDMRYKVKPMTFAFQVRNLFDEEYSAFNCSSSDGTMYSPGEERSFYASVMVEF
ncbi:MAG: TonB-dependent receptor [Deltaproteobacteria bacterium]|nr:TonB-dependent receptor [Deltaproteobacteria bacterium]